MQQTTDNSEAAMDAVAAAWDADAFVALLGKLVGEAKHLQNGVASTPTEDRGALAAPLRAWR